jgi:hypothetical protein
VICEKRSVAIEKDALDDHPSCARPLCYVFARLVPLLAIVLAITSSALGGDAGPKALVGVFRGTDMKLDPRATAEISRVLGAGGVGLVDAKAALSLPSGPAFSIERPGDQRAAAEVAMRSGANLLILGRTSTAGPTIGRSLAGITTSTGATWKVELRAIRPDNGAVLWSDAESGTGATRTATTVAGRFAADVVSQWRSTREAGQKKIFVRLTDASGKLSIADLREFKELLFVIVDGVEEVVQSALDDASALLEIEYKKDRPSFERGIDGMRFNDKKVTLKGVEKGTILVVLAPK